VFGRKLEEVKTSKEKLSFGRKLEEVKTSKEKLSHFTKISEKAQHAS
jgi:hypothetical protein